MKKVVDLLFDNADEKYRLFQAALIPTVDKDFIIGVRVPVLRTIAKILTHGFHRLKSKTF